MGMADQSTQPDRRGLIGWIIAHPKSTLALSILLMFALALLGLSHTAESRLNAKIAAIKAKGEPTTIQDLLARQRRIPDDKNRVAAVMEIGARLRSLKLTEEQTQNLPIEGTAQIPRTGTRWPDKQIKTAQAYLIQIQHDLTELHNAMKIPDTAYAAAWSSPAFRQKTMDRTYLFAANKALAIEATTFAMLADRNHAESTLVDLVPMLQILDGGQSIVDALAQGGINGLFLDTTERVINQMGLSDHGLKQIEEALHDESKLLINVNSALVTERVQFLDTVYWLRSNNSGFGRFLAPPSSQWVSPQTVWCYVPALPALDIAEGLDYYTALVNSVDGFNGESIRRARAVDARFSTMPWYSIVSKSTIGGLTRCVELLVRGVGQMRAFRVAVAAERYRLANNRWPVNAADLVPQFIDGIPPDPIDGNPIRYAIIPEGIKTWTISDENDNRDNGGDVQRIETGTNKHRPTDFGWVILNPDLRGRASDSPDVTAPSKTAPSTHPNTGK